MRELVVQVLLVVQGEQLRLDKYISNRTRERLTSCTWSKVSTPIVSNMCAARVPLYAQRARQWVRDMHVWRRGVPPRLQQDGGGEGDEAEDGELLIGVGVGVGVGVGLGLGVGRVRRAGVHLVVRRALRLRLVVVLPREAVVLAW